MDRDKEMTIFNTHLLQKYFDDDQLANVNNREELKSKLTSILIYMLLHEMEKLMAILYRIDVNEKKVEQVFAQNNPKAIAPLLADLIIERELEKAESRHKNR